MEICQGAGRRILRTVHPPWLLYGANGYTGELVARRAAAAGEKPILAGRTAGPIRGLAAELGLESRVFGLDAPSEVDRGLADVRAVLHCAGPFVRTFRPMSEGCLRAGAHYLDITGEIDVFESLAARDAEAKTRGVTLLPGVGFDVVPSDCLAAHVVRRRPGASRLVLAFKGGRSLSRGTATTAVERLHQGGAVRQDGKIVRVPAAWKTRRIEFRDGPAAAITIPWGDVSTAYHSTGVPDVEVYMAAPRTMRRMLRLGRPFLPLLKLTPFQKLLKARIRAGPPGPSAEERAQGRMQLWAEASDAAGSAVSRLETPEGYELTVRTALAAVRKVLGGAAPIGFQTPSRAFGPDFILEIEGTVREDL
jgi:short subunit dehydrogenase-like uncharacterized protein